MFRLTLKNLAANRVRFALTTFAVVLAVAFVVSSFVLTDGLRRSFESLSGEIVGTTDFEVRPEEVALGDPEPLPESLLAEIEAVDGVAAAAPLVQSEMLLRPVNGDGDQIPVNGPPQLAFGYVDQPRLSNLTVVEGSGPAAADEFTMDLDAAATHGFVIGETYTMITPAGTDELRLVGLTRFGDDNDTLGATLMQVDLAYLQETLGRDGYDSISVALASGADRAAVEAELTAVAVGATVVDQATLESETRAEFNSGIDILGNVLLGFAGISLFVSIFIIYNTFAIVLGQRTRELALLRTVGADPTQLQRSVLGEAIVIGVFASIVGIGAGVGVAFGLRALFDAIGAQLPDSPVIVSLRTVAVAAAVGVGVTLLSAIGPARKASRVAPMAALRDGATAGDVSSGVRFAIGALLTLVGIGVGAFGLFGAEGVTSIIAALAGGAIAVFVGVTLLSPLVAVPVTRILGWPSARLTGVSGGLARHNAGRNPHRTATTAAALMIGLALVAMTLTVGESTKAQLRATLDGAVQADYIVDSPELLPAAVGEELAALDETARVAGFQYDEALVVTDPAADPAGEVAFVMGADLAAMTEVFDIDLQEGAIEPGNDAGVLVSDERAAADGLVVGDVVPLTFASGASVEATVTGIYGDDIVVEDDFLVDASLWRSVDANPQYGWFGVLLADGVSIAEADEAMAPIGAAFPQATIETAGAFVEGIEGQIDQALATVNVMVALAVIIALIGIANTLALSVFERTRELGLLRAVGMTRRQLRRMVRIEAGLVALFGALLGVTIGVLFGWAAVAALPAELTSTLAIPVTRILILVAVAGAAGLLAALGPARRAAKLDVLDAIAT